MSKEDFIQDYVNSLFEVGLRSIAEARNSFSDGMVSYPQYFRDALSALSKSSVDIDFTSFH
jgi:hypothetical protein